MRDWHGISCRCPGHHCTLICWNRAALSFRDLLVRQDACSRKLPTLRIWEMLSPALPSTAPTCAPHQEQLARLLPVSAGVRRRQRRPAVLGSHAVAGMLLSAYAILTCLAPRQSPVVLLSLSHNMHAKDSKAIDFGWSVLHIKEQGTAKLGTTVTVRAPAGQGGGGCAAAVAAPEAAACCARQGCRAGRAAARMAPRPRGSP